MNNPLPVFIIEDDIIMAECVERALGQFFGQKNNLPTLVFYRFCNAIEAAASLNEHIPALILLDILLDGPDGFTFLNELATYTDTNTIPVILITSLNIQTMDLRHYNIAAILQKDFMTPATIVDAARSALGV